MSALGQKRTFLDVRFSLNDVRFIVSHSGALTNPDTERGTGRNDNH